MTPEKLTLEQIAKAAENVRTIERFQNESLNNGFNAGLISVEVIPYSSASKKWDWPFIFLIIFTSAVLVSIIVKSMLTLSQKLDSLLLICALLAGTLAVLSVHLKFKQVIASIILSVGLIVVISIGFGVLTPKEALAEAKEITKKT